MQFRFFFHVKFILGFFEIFLQFVTDFFNLFRRFVLIFLHTYSSTFFSIFSSIFLYLFLSFFVFFVTITIHTIHAQFFFCAFYLRGIKFWYATAKDFIQTKKKIKQITFKKPRETKDPISFDNYGPIIQGPIVSVFPLRRTDTRERFLRFLELSTNLKIPKHLCAKKNSVIINLNYQGKFSNNLH